MNDFVALAAFFRSEVVNRRKEIRIFVAQFSGDCIVLLRDHFLLLLGNLAKQIVREFASPVGCVDSRQGSNILPCRGRRDRCAGVESPFGVGDDVYLAASRLLDNLFYPLFQLQRAVVYCRRTVVLTVVDRRAVFLKFRGDTPPVVEVVKIAEEHAVY